MPTAATRSTTIVSLAALKAWMAAGGLSDATDDARLVRAADGASEQFEAAVARSFVTRSVTETVNGTGRNVLSLRRRPVTAMTSVAIDGVAIDSSEYAVDAELGLLWLKTRTFTGGVQNVVVAYSAGYGAQDAATLPADVVQAVLDLAKAAYDALSAGATAVNSVSVGNQTFILTPEDWPKSTKLAVRHWREVRA